MTAEITLLVVGLALAIAGAFTPASWAFALVGLALCAIALILQNRRLP